MSTDAETVELLRAEPGAQSGSPELIAQLGVLTASPKLKIHDWKVNDVTAA